MTFAPEPPPPPRWWELRRRFRLWRWKRRVGKFDRFQFPNVRQRFPSLDAGEIVRTQPMDPQHPEFSVGNGKPKINLLYHRGPPIACPACNTCDPEIVYQEAVEQGAEELRRHIDRAIVEELAHGTTDEVSRDALCAKDSDSGRAERIDDAGGQE